MLYLLSILDQLRLMIVFLLILVTSILLIKKNNFLSILFFIIIIYLFYPVYCYYRKAQNNALNTQISSSFLRVIQQNCWGKNQNAEFLISIIKEKKPDIVFLQECSPKMFQKIHESLSISYDIFDQFEAHKGKLFDRRLVILTKGFDLIKKFDNTLIPLYQIFLQEKAGKNA